MKWLSSPKVRLALIVNGIYFISLFAASPPPRYGRPDFFAQARARRAAAPPQQVRLPPPTAPSRAAAFESGGVLSVRLKEDLTLVDRPGRTVLLSPSYGAVTYENESPSSVLLNFIIYSDKEACPGDCPLTIAADGKVVWPDYRRADTPGYSRGWQRERVPYSSTESADGRVVETMAAESLSMSISYGQFLDTISATRVIIKLGPDRVELTAEQIEALRDMHRRLPQPPPPADSASR
jgi:hypothetical protein